MTRRDFHFLLMLVADLALAQTPAGRSFLATVTAKPQNNQLDIRMDGGEAAVIGLMPETVLQRIAPGEKDLKKAEAAQSADLAAGDRILVSLMPGTQLARRVVIMAASDIQKKNDAERADWQKRGVLGVVAGRKGDEITLRMRGIAGESTATVALTGTTKLRRYVPDSIKFADAKPSTPGEIQVGDQLRARGEKSADGLKVAAEEVVFGTFQTRAGVISSVDAEKKTITVAETGTNKPLVIRLAADSTVKRMPNFPGMAGGMPGGGGAPMPGGFGPGARRGAGPGMMPGGGPGGMPGGPGGGIPGGPGGRPGGPDLSQMLERLPQAKFEEFAPGETVIVSSTKGAVANEITAITLLGNAAFLVQMAQMQQMQQQMQRGAGAGPSLGGGGFGGMGGGAGLDLGGFGGIGGMNP